MKAAASKTAEAYEVRKLPRSRAGRVDPTRVDNTESVPVALHFVGTAWGDSSK
jgi:hypothetical protein